MSPTLKFQIFRIVAYIVILISLVKRDMNYSLFIVLIFVMEFNFWIGYYNNRPKTKKNKEIKTLLEDAFNNKKH